MDCENISIKAISERQNISERYLEQIFSLLRKSRYYNREKRSTRWIYFRKKYKRVNYNRNIESFRRG